MSRLFSLNNFNYDLPPELIAQEPAIPRDASRLLILNKTSGDIRHRQFRDIVELLKSDDLVVVNQTQVIPARLRAKKISGKSVELLLYQPLDGAIESAHTWLALAKDIRGVANARNLYLENNEHLTAQLSVHGELQISARQSLLSLLRAQGEMPLPPYINRAHPCAQDFQDYQSIFARDAGAVAAPTASLHFTDRVLAALRLRGVSIEPITLHVGRGTFLPIRKEHHEDIRKHLMHKEWYTIPKTTKNAIETTKKKGGRIIAVGTTVVRTLESWAKTTQMQGDTNLFIYPGFSFEVVDAMITNFHMPRTTLLALVHAFAGSVRVKKAYEEAVAMRYRFFSYGDAMFIC